MERVPKRPRVCTAKRTARHRTSAVARAAGARPRAAGGCRARPRAGRAGPRAAGTTTPAAETRDPLRLVAPPSLCRRERRGARPPEGAGDVTVTLRGGGVAGRSLSARLARPRHGGRGSRGRPPCPARSGSVSCWIYAFGAS